MSSSNTPTRQQAWDALQTLASFGSRFERKEADMTAQMQFGGLLDSEETYFADMSDGSTLVVQLSAWAGAPTDRREQASYWLAREAMLGEDDEAPTTIFFTDQRGHTFNSWEREANPCEQCGARSHRVGTRTFRFACPARLQVERCTLCGTGFSQDEIATVGASQDEEQEAIAAFGAGVYQGYLHRRCAQSVMEAEARSQRQERRAERRMEESLSGYELPPDDF